MGWGCKTYSGSYAGRAQSDIKTVYANEKLGLEVAYNGDYKLKTAKIKDGDLNLPPSVLAPLRKQLKKEEAYALLVGYTQPISPYYAAYGFVYPDGAAHLGKLSGEVANDMACTVRDVYVFAEDSVGVRIEYEPINEGIYVVEHWVPHQNNLLRLIWVANYKKSFTTDDFPFTPAPTKEQKIAALRKEAVSIVNSIK